LSAPTSKAVLVAVGRDVEIDLIHPIDGENKIRGKGHDETNYALTIKGEDGKAITIPWSNIKGVREL